LGAGYPYGVGGGTVKLGADNSIFVSYSGASANAQDLYMTAGALDINGNSQIFRLFTSENNVHSNSLPAPAATSSTPALVPR